MLFSVNIQQLYCDNKNVFVIQLLYVDEKTVLL
jgi:hypothetical protein